METYQKIWKKTFFVKILQQCIENDFRYFNLKNFNSLNFVGNFVSKYQRSRSCWWEEISNFRWPFFMHILVVETSPTVHHLLTRPVRFAFYSLFSKSTCNCSCLHSFGTTKMIHSKKLERSFVFLYLTEWILYRIQYV